jgi:hypothetical protein
MILESVAPIRKPLSHSSIQREVGLDDGVDEKDKSISLNAKSGTQGGDNKSGTERIIYMIFESIDPIRKTLLYWLHKRAFEAILKPSRHDTSPLRKTVCDNLHE